MTSYERDLQIFQQCSQEEKAIQETLEKGRLNATTVNILAQAREHRISKIKQILAVFEGSEVDYKKDISKADLERYSK